MKKTSIINWFRYHHYHTNPALESHSKFIGCLSALETDKWLSEHDSLGEKNTADECWKEILEAINQLTEEELEHLGRLIKQRYR
jgi:hypothetical protein